MERVTTGIPGLDPLIDGGIPKGFNVLIVGRPGTGKTIFGLQYLYNGALKGENGLYVTLDSNGEVIRQQAENFGWDVKKLEAEKKLCILDVPLNRQMRLNLFRLVEAKIKEYDIKRVVFDNLSSFMFNINQFNIHLPNIDDLTKLSRENVEYLEEDIGGVRAAPDIVQKLKPDPAHYDTVSRQRIVYLVLKEFSTLGTTNIVITSRNDGAGRLTVDGVSEFVSDSVIAIYNELIGAKHVRTVTILKMRDTDHSQYIHDLELGKNGIVIKPAEAVYK